MSEHPETGARVVYRNAHAVFIVTPVTIATSNASEKKARIVAARETRMKSSIEKLRRGSKYLPADGAQNLHELDLVATSGSGGCG